MYQSNMFQNFLAAQSKQYGAHHASYAREFERYDDEELLDSLQSHINELSSCSVDSDTYDSYFGDIQRIMECMKLRKEFRDELKNDELV